METVFHIISFVLFIGVSICAGWAFGACIAINKKLKEITNSQLKLMNLLGEENNHCKEVINHCKKVIDDNKTLLSYIKKYLIFIKQNMTRRKTPITDE